MRASPSVEGRCRIPVIAVMLCAVLCMPDARAEINIVDASCRVRGGFHVVDVAMEIDFSDEVQEALANGVPITIVVEINFKKTRKFLWDDTVASVKRKLRLKYHALTSQYMLTNQFTGERDTFGSLANAIDAMRSLQELPVARQDQLNPKQNYVGEISASLDVEALPAPLRPQAYLSPRWRLASNTLRWEFSP